MFNSNQLTQQYKLQASKIQPPTGHEQRIRQMYDKQFNNRSRARGIRSSKLYKAAVVSLIVAVVSGFTGYYYLKISDERIDIRYNQSASTAFDTAESARTYGVLSEARDQLAVGETAIVYVPELAKRFPGHEEMALIAVSQPEPIVDHEAWKTVVSEQIAGNEPIPLTVGEWTFDRGQKQAPYGGNIDIAQQHLLQELKQESASKNGAAAWKKAPWTKDDPFPNVLTAFYRNGSQTELYVSVTIIEQNTEQRINSSLLESEELNLEGVRAYYLRTEPFMFSKSNKLQEVTWVESRDNYSLIYSVGSDSDAIEKTELESLAHELVQKQER
ncbi:hypothetical protein [Paenibacillus sp. NPDC058071]|uniref:hypothetical protein n=1 Tax=Paenibacillus sp. NPDC058071 TaxID=3346326 RepID=UPI0036DC2176